MSSFINVCLGHVEFKDERCTRRWRHATGKSRTKLWRLLAALILIEYIVKDICVITKLCSSLLLLFVKNVPLYCFSVLVCQALVKVSEIDFDC